MIVIFPFILRVYSFSVVAVLRVFPFKSSVNSPFKDTFPNVFASFISFRVQPVSFAAAEAAASKVEYCVLVPSAFITSASTDVVRVRWTMLDDLPLNMTLLTIK